MTSFNSKTSYDYESFFNHSLDLMSVAGVDGHFKLVNPAFKKTLGWSEKTLLKRPFISFVHPDDVKSTLNEVKKLSKGQPTIIFENRYKCKDGKYKWLEWSAYPTKEGNLFAVARDVTQKKESNERILEFKLGIERSGEAIFITDKNGLINYVNPSFEKIYGYKYKEVIGKNPSILKSGRMPVSFYNDLWSSLIAKKQKKYVIVNKTKKGKFITIEASANPILDVSNNIIGFLAIQRDITIQRENQENLKREKEFSERILETMPNGMDIVDENLNILYMNNKFLNVFEKKSLGKKCYEVYRDNKTQCTNCPLKTKINVGETRTLVTQNVAGGKIFEITHTGMLLDGKKVIMEIFRDITEQKTAEDNLRKEKEFSDDLIANASNIIIGVNKKEEITLFNSLAESVSGYSKERVLKKSLSKFIYFEDKEKYKDIFTRIKGGQIFRGQECFLKTKKGKPKIISWSNTVIYDYDTSKYSIILIAEDISEKKAAQKEKEILNTELRDRVTDLEKFQKLTIGRELKMIELKRKVADLEKKLCIGRGKAND